MKFLRELKRPHQPTTALGDDEAAILQLLERDWRSLSRPQTGFARLDPSRIDRALPYSFVLERTAPGAIRTRVAGRMLHDYLQMDPRGMPFAAFFDDETRETVARLADLAFTGPSVVGIPLTLRPGLGRTQLRAEALLLPMRDAAGDVSRVMGALVVTGFRPGRRSIRFGLAPDQPIRCDTMTSVWPDRRARRGKAGSQPQSPHVDLIQNGADPIAAEQPPRPAPTLRLVVNNT